MHQSGLLNHAIQNSKQKDAKNPCSIDKKNNEDSGSMMLKLNDFSGSFVILGAGICIASVTFFVELISAKWKSSKASNI